VRDLVQDGGLLAILFFALRAVENPSLTDGPEEALQDREAVDL
jgi:hypothetical protein